MHVNAVFNDSTHDWIIRDMGIITTLRICEWSGWTIEQVTSLPAFWRRAVIGYLQGLRRIEDHQAQRAKLGR